MLGLTLDEATREVNARYQSDFPGIEVTPILVQRAPRFVYVLGEVGQAGRVELEGPTTAIQAISLAQGWTQGGNMRNVVVLRRDQHWNLIATRLDLAGALLGQRPHPTDEIWLRDSDIVIVPKMPIQRFSELVDLYITRTIYAIMPNQGFSFNFDGRSTF